MKKALFAVLLPFLTGLHPAANAQTPDRATPISSLQVTISTGGDDLRGGQVAYGAIGLRDGRTLPKVNLNGGRGWGNNSTNTVTVPLPSGIRLGDLAFFTLEHDGAPKNLGQTYDNWNLDAIAIATPRICSAGVQLANPSGRPFVRFTGRQTFQTIPLSVTASASASASALQVTIATGGDDLRKGQVAYGTIRLRDGRTLPKVNLNGGRGWGNNSTNTVSMPLPSGIRLGDLASLTLEHDGAPRDLGQTYDNWDVDALRVTTPQICSAGVQLANKSGRPFVRFTGAKTFEQIPIAPR